MNEILTAEEQKKLIDCFQALVEAIKKIIEDIVPFLRGIADHILTALRTVQYICCSGRVRHLTLYAKKARVRKKNRHRALKQFWEAIKYGI